MFGNKECSNFVKRVRLFARRLAIALPLPLSRWILLLQEYRRIPRLIHPRTFNEKVNFRIIHDRRNILITASSKVDSKEYVANLQTGVEIPMTIWSGTDLCELVATNIEKSWVLKASHRSGRLVSGGPGKFKIEVPSTEMDEWLEEREYRDNGLWAYRDVKREYILEERIGDGSSFPEDLKFFVFDGRVAMIQMDHGRHGKHSRNLYTADWEPLPWVYTHPRGQDCVAPAKLDEMLRIASAIGKDFDFIRVDLYCVDQVIFFGELTVYPAAGLSPWPTELDFMIGKYWDLPHRGEMRKDLQRPISITGLE